MRFAIAALLFIPLLALASGIDGVYRGDLILSQAMLTGQAQQSELSITSTSAAEASLQLSRSATGASDLFQPAPSETELSAKIEDGSFLINPAEVMDSYCGKTLVMGTLSQGSDGSISGTLVYTGRDPGGPCSLIPMQVVAAAMRR